MKPTTEHGTWGMKHAGCKCPECRYFHSSYMAHWREEHPFYDATVRIAKRHAENKVCKWCR